MRLGVREIYGKLPYMKKRNQRAEDRATGLIRVHSRGFGFVQNDPNSPFTQDIFIPKRATKGAVDGDHVEVSVKLHAISEKGPEGRVVKILERGRSHLAGTVRYVGKKNTVYAYAPLLGEDREVRVLSKERKLELGDRILIKVINWGAKEREPLGEMTAYIGHISDPSCDVTAAIEEFALDHEFSSEAIEEAEGFDKKVLIEKERRDFRSLRTLTIDPTTAKDFDDALSLTKDKRSHFHLGIHIADVSHFVRPGTALDLEARQRCNSTYFPGEVVPMLPHALSSDLCSLKPDVDRFAVSVICELDPEGSVCSYEIVRSVICSQKRFTYEEAKEVLDEKKKSPFLPDLQLMVELCHLLKKKRAERGSIEFALPDSSLVIDKEGVPLLVELVEYDITHQLVEEFMLKANETVATHLSNLGKPLTYRVHDEPDPETIREFAALASSLGFKISANPNSEELQTLFDEARESPYGEFLAVAFIKSMKLASYSTENVGHYGLGLEHYTHFTSPIRRYIDLVVHRLLFDELHGDENLEEVALKCSEKERLSSRAEGAVRLLKKLRLLSSFEEKDPGRSYRATVTVVRPFGFSFVVEDLLMDGFIEARECGLASGEKIEVKLTSLDLITQSASWDLP